MVMTERACMSCGITIPAAHNRRQCGKPTCKKELHRRHQEAYRLSDRGQTVSHAYEVSEAGRERKKRHRKGGVEVKL